MAARRSTKNQRVTKAALAEVGRLETPLGQSAMTLAAMMDDPDTPGTARVAAHKEHRAVMAEALRSATVVADPVDELRRRREERLAGGG